MCKSQSFLVKNDPVEFESSGHLYYDLKGELGNNTEAHVGKLL